VSAPTSARPASLIGRKQNSVQSQWVVAWQSISASPDRERANGLIAEAAHRIRARLLVSNGPAVISWSGGKDSLALEIVCRMVGLDRCVIVLSRLEFPAFERWVRDFGPPRLDIERREQVDLDWLRDHPEMLFPKDSRTASRWYALVQHTGQRSYAKRNRIDLMLMGRRSAEGNYLGRRLQHGCEYRDREGFHRYSPLADWTHEDVLHVLAANDVALPPLYSWPRGFRVGTGPWAKRRVASHAQGWREVLAIDPSVIRAAAAAGIYGAAEFA
jgi:3'-phosphoadenosine 5'-phosphosulfate sulfotransferase (PAPS reductase)/FAD synthetase